MVDRFRDPLLTPQETARHLQIPEQTLRSWLRDQAAGHPLVHSVPAERRGWPSVPFVAVIEAYVLRALRNLGLPTTKIRAAATDVRELFGTEYGLATRRIATDGLDIFVHYLDSDEIARAGDRQMPIRRVIDDYLKYVVWDDDDFPKRLILKQYDPDIAKVVIDPRFAWGAPILQASKTPVEAIVGMWRAGETADVVADEYGLTRDQVEAIVRVAT
ncbi:DUF433 domain-containing protein [Planosporangium flavigriseum]|uniref:Putative antitoxin VapB45-like DNA-binding HTH domain-containing protein n=1 Tax=Planosporangium flavigriseum TaxID=373681 RepID=A0A8J3LVJ9_9ACTN|nr:DUF433 domain-containing protein [Planosporangium flavigriseum]NJC63921.1 DUF433 domain-containing protein [Planosporangium flavigriseum]GIG74634.1 hypothetical protein Pfl04_30380 [Planosporangium flavigriseum]